MKSIYYMTPAAYMLLMQYVGPVAAFAVVALLIAVAFLIWRRYQTVKKLKEYGRRIENIYVLSLRPGDRSVMRRVAKERDWLERSGNRLGVQVIPIFFKDAENVTESWEEFQERAEMEIADDRRRRHTSFSETDRSWYIRYHHRQN